MLPHLPQSPFQKLLSHKWLVPRTRLYIPACSSAYSSLSSLRACRWHRLVLATCYCSFHLNLNLSEKHFSFKQILWWAPHMEAFLCEFPQLLHMSTPVNNSLVFVCWIFRPGFPFTVHLDSCSLSALDVQIIKHTSNFETFFKFHFPLRYFFLDI